jgi:hypothetical protein
MNVATGVGLVIAGATGGTCRRRSGSVACEGAHYPGSQRAFTVGNVVISRRELTNDEFGHELVHVQQYRRYGGVPFAGIYIVTRLLYGECNVFEREAGFAAGGYRRCR